MSKKENNEERLLKGKVIFFATGNIHKFDEARSILSQMGYAVALLRVKGDEIQSESLKDIAATSAANAHKRSKLPIFVEDAGLFIDALEGFPGPYAAYVYKTIHNNGVLKLMHGVKNRGAKFQSVIAYIDGTLSEPQCFEGESEGEITLSERKTNGRVSFGFDPVFQPAGSNMSFAEMTIKEKNNFSHRANALQKFAAWYSKRQ